MPRAFCELYQQTDGTNWKFSDPLGTHIRSDLPFIGIDVPLVRQQDNGWGRAGWPPCGDHNLPPWEVCLLPFPLSV